jgi:hypothetical protein
MPQRKATKRVPTKRVPTPVPDEVLKEIEAYGQAYEDHLVRALALAAKETDETDDGVAE